MELGDRLGFAGLIVGLLAIGVTILWPTKRWIAYWAFGVAFLLGGCWVVAEYHSHFSHTSPLATKPSTAVTVNGNCSSGNSGDGNKISVDCSETSKQKKK